MAGLMRSIWALVAAALAAGFVWWAFAARAAPGARAGSDPAIVLWSGWAALALMLLVSAYSVRKAIHRTGLSPEFRRAVPIRRLEEAETELSAVREEIASRRLESVRDVRSRVRSLLRRHGVHRVCRAVVSARGGRVEVRIVPADPLGRMSRWLHFHAWVGAASGVIVFVHGGLSFASRMGAFLNVLAILVLGTGVAGILLFAVGPTWITRKERGDSFEAVYIAERMLRDDLLEEHADDERAILEEQHRRAVRRLSDLRRTWTLLNGWRLLHVPLTVVLLLAGIVHLWSVWRW